MMRPLLERLQILSICSGDISVLFWKMLPLWAVELRFLQLEDVDRSFIEYLRLEYRNPSFFSYTFRKLVKLSYIGEERALKNLIIGNPQLREALLEIDYETFLGDLILKNLPQLETLNMNYHRWPRYTRDHCKSFARMSELQSFTASGPVVLLEEIMHEIGKFDISLKYLYLRVYASDLVNPLLLGDILRLNQLEELVLAENSEEGGYDALFFKYEAQPIEALKKQSVCEFVMQLGGHAAAVKIANQVFSQFNVFFDLKRQNTILSKKPLDP